MYKVYVIDSEVCYTGYALVASENAEMATKEIEIFKKADKDNSMDSKGYHSSVSEDDALEGVFSENSGIIFHGIRYTGWC